MTIDLFLCGFKGLQVLKFLCLSRYVSNIQSVIAARDQNVINDYFNEIKSTCVTHGLKFTDRENHIPLTNADYRFLIGWKWMIKDTENAVVFHDSLLPAYRGFAPLVNALINGESRIGATAILATNNYDTGPILASKSISITHPIRIQKAIEEMGNLYVVMVEEVIGKLLLNHTLEGIPQDESKASYSLWRDEEDYLIDWNNDSDRILRTIYALSYPYQGARTMLNGKPVVVDDAEVFPDVNIVNRNPGKVIFNFDDGPVVVCGKGLLKITSASDKNDISVIPLKKFRSRFGK